MKHFNKQTFIIFAIISGLLLVPAFIAAAAEDEGTLGTNMFWILFAKLFYVLRFPTHTLFWKLFSMNGSLFFLGLFINCLFFGFISERIISVFKKK